MIYYNSLTTCTINFLIVELSIQQSPLIFPPNLPGKFGHNREVAFGEKEK